MRQTPKSIVRHHRAEFWATGQIPLHQETSRLGWPSEFLYLTSFDDTPLCIAIDAMREMYTFAVRFTSVIHLFGWPPGVRRMFEFLLYARSNPGLKSSSMQWLHQSQNHQSLLSSAFSNNHVNVIILNHGRYCDLVLFPPVCIPVCSSILFSF